jgi:hypothetical protein
MRVVVIKDEDAKNLVEQLKLEKLETKDRPQYFGNHLPENLSHNALVRALTEEIHRTFHHRVVTWLQDQGADLR